MRRSRGLLVVALAVVSGMLAVGAWRHGRRGAPPPLIQEPATERTDAPTPPTTRRTESASTAAPAADEQLLAGIRETVRSDPRAAESMARAARARFPGSPHADEWDALLVDALVNQQRIGAARSETYYYYDHHPGGTFTAHLFTLTGVHPAPVGPGPH